MLRPHQHNSVKRIPAFISLIGSFCLCAGPALATVLEIEPGGGVVRYDQPAQYLSPDMQARPLAAPVRRSATPQRSSPSQARPAIDSALRTASRDNAIGQDLLDAVAWRESAFRPDAVSSKGAVGVMQLMPGTARALGVDATDGPANVQGGARYLRALLTRYDGDIIKTLAAYNAGPAAVDRYGGAPPFAETKAFINAILDRLAERAAAPHRPSNRDVP